jgi:hypothetical protein
VLRRHRWCRPVPLIVDGTLPVALPKALDGLSVFEVDRPWMITGLPPATVGIIRDKTAGTITTVMPVAGDGQFALADPAAQDSKVDLWGLALAGFCREGGHLPGSATTTTISAPNPKMLRGVMRGGRI